MPSKDIKNTMNNADETGKTLTDEELLEVNGGSWTDSELNDSLIAGMEGIVIVDDTTMNQILNLSYNQRADLWFKVSISGMMGASVTKEMRYENFCKALQSYGISTSGCRKAF